MATPANGRWFFEGMPLGNQPPISFHATEARSVKGFYPGSRSEYTAPLIGAYGWGRRLTVVGQIVADDGDFLTMLQTEEAVNSYLRTTTKEIEDYWLRQHDVLQRTLGTLGYVVDTDTQYVVESLNVIASGDYAMGTTKFVLDTLVDGLIEVGDRVVITQDPADGVTEKGEIGIVTVAGSNFIWVVSRNITIEGASTYSVDDNLIVHVCEGFYENVAFRDSSYARPRNLAEAAGPPAGINYTFEGFGEFTRRSQIAASVYTPPDGDQFGESQFGAQKFGASA